MKINESRYSIINKKMYNEIELIEKIGRICYKSEDSIKEGSASTFVRSRVLEGHLAMIEHANLAFKVNDKCLKNIEDLILMYKYTTKKPEFFNISYNIGRCIVSANLRAWKELMDASIENLGECLIAQGMFDEFKRLSEIFCDIVNSKYVNIDRTLEAKLIDVDKENLTEDELRAHQYTSVIFTVDRGITHEFVRHRPASFAQESTRYCNYSKDKFDNNVNFIDIKEAFELDKIVSNLNDEEQKKIYDEWWVAMEDAERHYLKMIELGASPQVARGALPCSTKADIAITANREEWEHIFSLRDSMKAHPQMVRTMSKLHKEMAEYGRVSFNCIDKNRG